ncbi:MAG: hypothetical protein WAM66_10255 [Acidobacteriaceae bacterium]
MTERAQRRGLLSGAQKLPKDIYWAPACARVKPGIIFSYTVWKNRRETAVELFLFSDQNEAKRIFDSLYEKKLQIE